MDEAGNDWAQLWAPGALPDPDARSRAWVEVADGHGVPYTPPADLPTLFDFSQTLHRASGVGGLDGWEPEEFQSLKYLPPFVEWLFDLLTETSKVVHRFIECNDHDAAVAVRELWTAGFWASKTIAMPKGSAFESRPLSISSHITRAWHRAILAKMPPMEAWQMAGQPGVSVSNAVGAFLVEAPCAGVEMDLSKAYDTLDHRLVSVALKRDGLSSIASAMIEMSWRGQKFFCVSGQFAKPLIAVVGIPQGDPMSGRGLAAVLAPWPRVVRAAAPDAKCFTWVDDRTIAVGSAAQAPHSSRGPLSLLVLSMPLSA